MNHYDYVRRSSFVSSYVSMTLRVLNKYSRVITQPKSQGASQAMCILSYITSSYPVVHATGLKPDDLSKPQVGISSVWYEGNPW